MAFSDPQSVTVNGSAQSMPNIAVSPNATTYQSADENYVLVISHQVTGKDRHRALVKLTERKVVTDPLASTNDYDTIQVSVTIDRPTVGWTATQTNYVVQALTGWLNSTAVSKLFGKEH